MLPHRHLVDDRVEPVDKQQLKVRRLASDLDGTERLDLRLVTTAVNASAACSNACAGVAPKPRTPTSASWGKCSHPAWLIGTPRRRRSPQAACEGSGQRALMSAGNSWRTSSISPAATFSDNSSNTAVTAADGKRMGSFSKASATRPTKSALLRCFTGVVTGRQSRNRRHARAPEVAPQGPPLR